MNFVIAEYRARIVKWAVILAVGMVGVWWATKYRPLRAEIVAERSALYDKRERVRAARMQVVEIGLPGIEAAIEGYRGSLQDLLRQVPSANEASSHGSAIMDSVSAAAMRYGVQIQQSAALGAVDEGPVQIHGTTFHVVGRYHDVGAFLTSILSLGTVTQIRSAKLEVVPDSVIAEALRNDERAKTSRISGPRQASSIERKASSRSVAAVGVEPFNVAAVFTLNWFVLKTGEEAFVGVPSENGVDDGLRIEEWGL